MRRGSWVKIWWSTSTIISRIIPSSCFLHIVACSAADSSTDAPFCVPVFVNRHLVLDGPAPVVRPPPRPRPLPIPAASPPRPRRLHSPMSSSTTSTVSGAFSSVLQRTAMTRRRRIAFAAVIADIADLSVITSVSTGTFALPTLSPELKRRLRIEEPKSSSSKPKKVERFFVVYQWHSVVLVRSVNLREEHRRLFGSFLLDFSK